MIFRYDLVQYSQYGRFDIRACEFGDIAFFGRYLLRNNGFSGLHLIDLRMRYSVIVDPCAVTLAFIARYEFLAREGVCQYAFCEGDYPFGRIVLFSAQELLVGGRCRVRIVVCWLRLVIFCANQVDSDAIGHSDPFRIGCLLNILLNLAQAGIGGIVANRVGCLILVVERLFVALNTGATAAAPELSFVYEAHLLSEFVALIVQLTVYGIGRAIVYARVLAVFLGPRRSCFQQFLLGLPDSRSG